MTEHDLPDVLERLGDRAPVSPPPTSAMLAAAGRARRRRTAWTAVGVAAAVAVVTGGVTVLGQQGGPSGRGDRGPEFTPTASVRSPGTRLVGIGRVTVEVPATWSTNATHCGTPQEDTVVLGGGAFRSCKVSCPKGVESIWVGRGSELSTFSSEQARLIDIDGQASEVAPTTCRSEGPVLVCRSSVYLSRHDVLVGAESSTGRDEVDGLVERVRILRGMVAVPRFLGGNNTADTEPAVDMLVRRLETLGLGAEVRHEFVAAVDGGDVLRTSPEPGTVVEPGTTVIVTAASHPQGPADQISVGLTWSTRGGDDRALGDAEIRAGETIRVSVGDRLWAYGKGHRESTLAGALTGPALEVGDQGSSAQATTWRATRPGTSRLTLSVSDGVTRHVIGTVTVVVD